MAEKRALRVQIGKETVRGMLFPSFDESNDLLILESKEEIDKGPYATVNIDDSLILSANQERILEHAILLRRRSLWRVQESPLDWRLMFGSHLLASKAGSVVFAEETLDHWVFREVSVEVTTDINRSRAWISLGEPTGSVRPVELSQRCHAFVDEGRLLGFFVELK